MIQHRNNSKSTSIRYSEQQKGIQRGHKTKERCSAIGKIGQNIRNYVRIYFKHSCMHGLKYVVDDDMGLTLKLMWSIIWILCLMSCFIIGWESVQRFRYKSTVIGVERDFHYWNTSIPSITVCPISRLSSKKFESYCKAQNIVETTDRQMLFQFLENLANTSYNNFEGLGETQGIDVILDRLGIRPKHYMELIYNLTADLIDAEGYSILSSLSGSNIIEVRQVLTEQGICYMTNSVLGPEYSLDYALFGRKPKRNPKGTKFIKGSFFDREMTIYFFGFDGNGTISFIHSSFEVPDCNKGGGFAPEVMRYNVLTKEIITGDNFETDVAIAQRKCRFHHESNLTHFEIYTKNLCIQECRINVVYDTCGCIPHFYPNRIPKPKPVCDYKTLLTCLPRSKRIFANLFEENNGGDGENAKISCRCLDNCEDGIITLNERKQLQKIKQFTYTIGVQLDIKEWPMLRLRRQVVYSLKDLMISLGSTAGLFLGFSVLSLVELIYFFTIRLFFHLRGIKL